MIPGALAAISRRMFATVVLPVALAYAGCATLEGVAEETKKNGDKLADCRAEARRAYYTHDAGLEPSLQAYEACKRRDGGAEGGVP